MIGNWHTEVRREYAGLDARFELPIRPLGWARVIGLALVGFGVFFAWSPALGVWQTVRALLDGTPEETDTLLGLFQVPFLLAGGIPLVLGLLVLFGRCRVEWKDGRLRSTEILGPFWWTRRMPRQPLQRLGVMAAPSGNDDDRPRGLGRLAGLFAEFEDGPRRIVALGYPKEWLLTLARELETLAGARGFAGAPVKVALVEQWSPDEEDGADLTDQPPGSRVRLEEWSSGVRLTVPAAGLWRGSRGLFFFALVWCGFMAVFTVGAAIAGFEWDGKPWMPILFIAAFWASGLGLLAVAVHMGRRTAVIAIEDGRLLVETRGLFGVKRQEWNPGELSAVRADAGGLEVNERPVLELQIHPVGGKKWGLLGGRDEDELRWMATCLRRALKLPAHSPHPEGPA